MLIVDREGTADDHTIELIAERVIEALHDNLEATAAHLATPTKENDQLTVEQVAKRLGVSRSTVYAHWREWGGYKLGSGPKAPIRFDSSALPVPTTPENTPRPAPGTPPARTRPPRRRRRRDLLIAAPRLAAPLDEVA